MALGMEFHNASEDTFNIPPLDDNPNLTSSMPLNCSKDQLPKWAICIPNPEEMLHPWMINPMFIGIVIVYTITFALGFVGNVVVLTVMIGDRKTRSATNLFLVSLAVADLLLLTVSAPLETIQYFVIQWDEVGTVCKMAKYAELLSAVASILNLAAVTLERFIVIVFPMRSRSLCTLSNCRRVILAVWLTALLLTLPVVFTKETYPIMYTNNVTSVTLYYCNDKGDGTIFAIYQFVILFGAPGTLMIICYTYVIRELWQSTLNIRMLTNSITKDRKSKTLGEPTLQNNPGKSPNSIREGTETPTGPKEARSPDTSNEEIQHNSVSQSQGSLKKLVTKCNSKQEVVTTGATSKAPRRSNKGDDALKGRKQVIKMLILVIIIFITCWGPRIIMEILIKVGLTSFTSTVYTLRVVFYVLPYIHACINPFIYSFMSKNFRRSLQRQMKQLGCKKRKRGGRGTACNDLSGFRSSVPRKTIGSVSTTRFRGSSTTSGTICHTDPTKYTEVETVLAMLPATNA